MAEAAEERIDQHPHEQHAEDVSQVSVLDAVEQIFDEVKSANEPGCRDSDDDTKNRVKREGQRCRCVDDEGGDRRHCEGRLRAEK